MLFLYLFLPCYATFESVLRNLLRNFVGYLNFKCLLHTIHIKLLLFGKILICLFHYIFQIVIKIISIRIEVIDFMQFDNTLKLMICFNHQLFCKQYHHHVRRSNFFCIGVNFCSPIAHINHLPILVTLYSNNFELSI